MNLEIEGRKSCIMSVLCEKGLKCFVEALFCFPSSWKNMNNLCSEYIYK